jgi:hypothetical protein
LDQFIHPEDLAEFTGRLFEDADQLTVMPVPLARLVSAAETTNMGSAIEPKFIPELSAVRTNSTRNDKRKTVRYWYMLPKFVRRHLPDLLIPRVNYRHPKSILNAPEKVLIDANFSTLWLNDGATIKPQALLAFLKSSWAIAAMELSATVLGGGALKLEAAHIRHLPIPKLSGSDWAKLSTLGEQLVSRRDVAGALTEIDRLIARVVFKNQQAESALAALRQINAQRLDARKNK